MPKTARKDAVSQDLDDVIRRQYQSFNTPVDQLVSDPAMAEEFAELVRADFSSDGEIDIRTVNRRLLTLRKRGEEKGGLPRLQRSYHGRESKQSRSPKPR